MTTPTTQDAVFSAEPPKEPGKYWLQWPCHEDTIGDFTGKHWWLVCGSHAVTSEQLNELGWQFGPRIPTPSESASLPAFHAEVEEYKKELRDANLNESIVGLVAAIQGARIYKFQRDQLGAEVERLRGALKVIESYGIHHSGCCPYGCDTPFIATAALAPTATGETK